MLTKCRIVHELKSYDELFNLNVDTPRMLAVLRGSVPILISAPHATFHTRDGVRKYPEILTGSIGYWLHEKLGCHLVTTLSEVNFDGNWDNAEDCTYKQFLTHYTKDESIKLLIDIHGCHASESTAVEIGTSGDNSSLCGKDFIVDYFADKLSLMKDCYDKVNVNKYFCGNKPNSVTRYVSKSTNVPCLQLVINDYYRDLSNPAKAVELVSTLYDIIKWCENNI